MFINAALIKQGYARSNKKLLLKYSKVFEQYEMEARRKRKGMWSEWVDKKRESETRRREFNRREDR